MIQISNYNLQNIGLDSYCNYKGFKDLFQNHQDLSQGVIKDLFIKDLMIQHHPIKSMTD